MLHFSRWKIVAIVLTCLLGAMAAVPNFFSKTSIKSWPGWLYNSQINLGLDLRGGAHMLAQIDVAGLKKEWLDNIRDDMRSRLRKAQIGYTGLGNVGDKVQVTIVKVEDVDKAVKDLRGMIQQIGGSVLAAGTPDLSVTQEGSNRIVVAPTEAAVRARIDTAMSSVIEIVRRRLDPGGNREITLQRQGADRIVIQEPGVEDTSETRARLKQTAKLTFHLVHPTVSADDARATRIPAGYKLFPSEEDGGGFELLQERAIVGGEDLVSSEAGFDSRTNEPVVNFRFNTTGAKKFGAVTQRFVGQRFAIVLDGKVISAPVIREPILGGSGQISGSFTVQSANRLGILLSSGALPTSLTVVEERTVGPSLGSDSIKAGALAAVVGSVGVVVFMVFAYGLFGIFAVIAVTINIVLILGLMTFLQSTLTLPGIAGIV
ncbi:MAG: protein translocase subunit SecD, partial [Hyphomicrobiaceae bacterium]|nr:protein translocase subunit SecD [Hyphomicrobiaceae bacterium]